jgi:5,10-methylenetetrahydromethanopterin reductase
MLPDYPLEESLRAIKLADELGFYGCYAADETWHKDLWLLVAAAARDTTNIRFGPSLSGVVLREPTLIAQAAATLDELTNGRAEVVLGSGNFGLLALYDIDWARTKPLSRVKEGVQVIRTLLDDGAITFDGEFFKYHGLFTFARPVQERLPVKMGSMRGPKSFEVAGEFSDGCHHALGYTRRAYEYGFEHFRAGAERAGKKPRRPGLRGLGLYGDRAGLGGSEAGSPLDGRNLRLIHAEGATRTERGRPGGAHPHRRSHGRRGSGQEH